MLAKIKVFGGSVLPDNCRALEMLKTISDVDIQVVSVAGILDGHVALPFIETPDGQRRYGLDSIEKFAREWK